MIFPPAVCIAFAPYPYSHFLLWHFLIKAKILWLLMQIWIFLITKEIKYIIMNIGHLCFCCERLFKASFIFILEHLYFSNWFLRVLYIFWIIIICLTVSLNKQMFFTLMYPDFYVCKNTSVISSWLAIFWSFLAGPLPQSHKDMIYFLLKTLKFCPTHLSIMYLGLILCMVWGRDPCTFFSPYE